MKGVHNAILIQLIHLRAFLSRNMVEMPFCLWETSVFIHVYEKNYTEVFVLK